MSVLEIKNDLLKLMGDTDDPEVLESVYFYFKQLKDVKLTPQELAEQEDRMIEIGEQQIQEGKVMSHTEAQERIKELFKNLGHE